MKKHRKESQDIIDDIVREKGFDDSHEIIDDIEDAEVIPNRNETPVSGPGLFGMLNGKLPDIFNGDGSINMDGIEELTSNIKYGTHFTLIRSVFEKFDKEFSSIIEDIVMCAGKEFNEILFNCSSVEELQIIATREMMSNSTSIDNKVNNTAIRMYSGYKLLDRFFKGNKEKMVDFIEVYRRDVKEETKNKWNMSTDGAVGDAITMLCKEIEETAISVLFLYEKWIGLELNKEVKKDGE